MLSSAMLSLCKMANIAQIVNVIAPVFTRKDGLVLQTIFYPFEVYSSTCGQTALDVRQTGDTFSGGKYTRRANIGRFRDTGQYR